MIATEKSRVTKKIGQTKSLLVNDLASGLKSSDVPFVSVRIDKFERLLGCYENDRM